MEPDQPRAAIAVPIAVLWTLALWIHDAQLSLAADTPFRDWLFLPAGFRLIAVMVLGWTGVAGIVLGSFVDSFVLRSETDPALVLVLLAGPLAAMLAARMMAAWGGLHFPWDGIASRHLLAVSALAAGADAVLHSIAVVLCGLEELDQAWYNASVILVGDFLGAMIFLHLAVLARMGVRALTSTAR